MEQLAETELDADLDCGSTYGRFIVPSSKPGSTHAVTFHGRHKPPDCTCPAWRLQKVSIWDRMCKHILLVQRNACLYNGEAWDEPEDITMHPVFYAFGLAAQATDTMCPYCHSSPLVRAPQEA